jgi:hypothetical protein
VGDIYLDASTAHLQAQHRRWNADVAEYIPFALPVPFRDGQGVFMETGTSAVAKNHWGVGVRRDQIVWVANEGETPGYDIEDRRESPPIAYEVKGTTGSAFPPFDITANELASAEALGDRYFIVLVSGCMGSTPKFDLIQNPALKLQTGLLQKAPVAFRISSGS